jgi:TPR repeat protein
MSDNPERAIIPRAEARIERSSITAKRILGEMVENSLALAKEFVLSKLDLDALVQKAKRIQRKEGMTAEDIQAVELFYRAAIAGHAEAQCHLSNCYALGNGVEKNIERALEWLQRSVQYVGRGRWAIELRVVYATGLTDFSKDYIDAASWYPSIFDQGAANEQFQIGECYRKGMGVPQDYCEAAEWYQKAAEQGYADAQYRLGLYFRGGEDDGCYEHITNGLANSFLGEKLSFDVLNAKSGEIIIPANRRMTRTLLRKLAKLHDQCDIGPSPMRERLKEIVARCDRGAVVWFRRAAEQGHLDAQRQLEVRKPSAVGFEQGNSARQ